MDVAKKDPQILSAPLAPLIVLVDNSAGYLQMGFGYRLVSGQKSPSGCLYLRVACKKGLFIGGVYYLLLTYFF